MGLQYKKAQRAAMGRFLIRREAERKKAFKTVHRKLALQGTAGEPVAIVQPGAALFPNVGGANDALGWINNLSGSLVETPSTGSFKGDHLGTRTQRGPTGDQIGMDVGQLFCGAISQTGLGIFQDADLPIFWKNNLKFPWTAFIKRLCEGGTIDQAIKDEACIMQDRLVVYLLIAHALLLTPFAAGAAFIIPIYEACLAITVALCKGDWPAPGDVLDLVSSIQGAEGNSSAGAGVQIPEGIVELAEQGASLEVIADAITNANTTQSTQATSGGDSFKGSVLGSGTTAAFDWGNSGADLLETPLIQTDPVSSSDDYDPGVVAEVADDGVAITQAAVPPPPHPPQAPQGGILIPAAAALLLLGVF